MSFRTQQCCRADFTVANVATQFVHDDTGAITERAVGALFAAGVRLVLVMSHHGRVHKSIPLFFINGVSVVFARQLALEVSIKGVYHHIEDRGAGHSCWTGT
jgi:hypothetical protein